MPWPACGPWPEHAGVAAGDQVTERDEADEPALHLPGVGFDRQVNVVPGVIGAHGDLAVRQLSQPSAAPCGSADRALPGQLGRDRVLVQAPHERPAIAILFSGVPEGPLSGPVSDGPDNGHFPPPPSV